MPHSTQSSTPSNSTSPSMPAPMFWHDESLESTNRRSPTSGGNPYLDQKAGAPRRVQPRERPLNSNALDRPLRNARENFPSPFRSCPSNQPRRRSDEERCPLSWQSEDAGWLETDRKLAPQETNSDGC